MVNNSDGNSPTLRPQLGVGWNRALPAPFGFDNGLYPNNSNQYLVLRQFEYSYNSYSFEYWYKGTDANSSVFSIAFDSLTKFFTHNFSNTSLLELSIDGTQSDYKSFAVTNSMVKNHIVVNVNLFAKTINLYQNGFNYGTVSFTPTLVDATALKIFFFAQGNFNANHPTFYAKNPIDEFRVYNKLLTNQEVQLNFNNGFGDNSSNTESLLAWFNFQKFENLDFSSLQDNSDIRLAVRDLSGKNNHAQPINMDTNPASPTYVLKPF